MIVLTLDAGGSKFVFSAIKDGKFIGESKQIPSNGHDLDKCLSGMIDGFKQQQMAVGETIDAISFGIDLCSCCPACLTLLSLCLIGTGILS